MENNFYKDDFEQFLQSSADEFLMVPSRKVWYSIYNNMHPDRKWPSLTVCLIILSAVLFIGISNNNSIGDAARRAGAENLNSIAENYVSSNSKSLLDPVVSLSAVVYRQKKQSHFSMLTEPAENNADQSGQQTNSVPDQSEQGSISGITNETISENISVDKRQADVLKEAGRLFASVITASGSAPASRSAAAKHNLIAQNTQKQNTAPAGNSANEIFSLTDDLIAADDNLNSKLKTAPAEKNNIADKLTLANSNRAWIEDHAFHNKPQVSKFKQNSSLTYYIAPSASYRRLSRKAGYTPASTAFSNQGSMIAAAPAGMIAYPEYFDDAASLGLEIGASLNYSVSDNFRLKTGLQVNYSNYITKGTELGHPTQTTVALLNNPAKQMIRSAYYSTAKQDGNATNINHSSVQVSIPAGFDFAIAGNDKIKWYVGAAVQPSYTFGGNALVFSSDEKNFVSEKSLQRKLNINIAAETFVSYKTGKGIVVNIGPQVRYQVLSSFKSPYAYKEKLISTGVKLGITRNF